MRPALLLEEVFFLFGGSASSQKLYRGDTLQRLIVRKILILEDLWFCCCIDTICSLQFPNKTPAWSRLKSNGFHEGGWEGNVFHWAHCGRWLPHCKGNLFITINVVSVSVPLPLLFLKQISLLLGGKHPISIMLTAWEFDLVCNLNSSWLRAVLRHSLYFFHFRNRLLDRKVWEEQRWRCTHTI